MKSLEASVCVAATRKGNRWLRRALAESAWAAQRVKDSYLAAQFRRLSSRRGKKRALVAVGHSLLVIIYHVLRTTWNTRILVPNYFDRLEPERLRRYLVKRLQRLGYGVTLTPNGRKSALCKATSQTRPCNAKRPLSVRGARQGPVAGKIFGAVRRYSAALLPVLPNSLI